MFNLFHVLLVVASQITRRCLFTLFVCLNVYCRLVVHIKLQVILKKTLCKYYQYHREINYIEIK